MTPISIQTIPHSRQRIKGDGYVGDWYYRKGVLMIRVSRMGNWQYETLVAVHELIEAVICQHRGITQKDVDAFDIAYEKARTLGDLSEPGDATSCPYRFGHYIAVGVERILAAILGVGWREYEDAINAM